MNTQITLGILGIVLFTSIHAVAQQEDSVTDAVIVSEEVVASAKRASEELGLPVVLVKMDNMGRPVSGEETLIVSTERNEKPNVETSAFSTEGEISVVAGLPNLPAVRGELKTLKGTIGVGAEVGTLTGHTINGALLVNIAPLASLGINNVYGGYRLYGLKFFPDEGNGSKSLRVNSFVAGFRHKNFFIEAGKGKYRRVLKNGQIENERAWVGSVGFVVNGIFKRK